MSTPVFVIHGVGNRDKSEFERTARALGAAVRPDLVVHPIFWGDLGACYERIAVTVPGAPDPRTETRDADPGAPDDDVSRSLAEFLIGGGREQTRDDTVPGPVLDAATAALATGSDEIRDDTDPPQAPEVRAAIAEHWPSTTWLPLIDDDDLLRAVGTAVGAPLADAPDSAAGSSEELRDGEELRGLDVRRLVRRRLEELDRVVGAAFGAAGGRLNRTLRTTYLDDTTKAVGDILVYQRHQATIQDRVRTEIAKVDPDLGRSPEHPVDVLAHSLGGVIAVDMAIAEEIPLWIRRLVTFGSQAPFFHVCDPRGGVLTKYIDTPVSLPASIGDWTNLWEPLDPVAFVAARVFQLADGRAPIDIRVPHLASSGLWTHTDYWKLRFVADAIATALGRPARPAERRG